MWSCLLCLISIDSRVNWKREKNNTEVISTVERFINKKELIKCWIKQNKRFEWQQQQQQHQQIGKKMNIREMCDIVWCLRKFEELMKMKTNNWTDTMSMNAVARQFFYNEIFFCIFKSFTWQSNLIFNLILILTKYHLIAFENDSMIYNDLQLLYLLLFFSLIVVL